MKNLYSIGEVSKIKEITIKSLRYYHKMGILIPKYIDNTTGYRYYSIDQFVYIDIIKACRTLGSSILEVQEIFKERDTDKLIEFLQLKRSEAEANINKMKEIINDIDTLDTSVKKSKEILNNDKISIQTFEERYIIVAPFEEEGSLKEVLYYSQLDKLIQDKNVDTYMERGILYDFELDEYLKPRYVFNCIKQSFDMKIEDYIKILPKGRYVTLAYSKENEEASIKQIISYIKENNFKVKNIVEVELFNDFFNIESYSCQIQVLIADNF